MADKTQLNGSGTSESLTVVHMKVRQQRNAFMIELLDIAACAYQDMHVWSALLTCLRPTLQNALGKGLSDLPCSLPAQHQKALGVACPGGGMLCTCSC